MLNFITSLLFYSNEISAQKVRQALLLIGKNTSKQFLQAKQVEVAIFALWRMVSPFPLLSLLNRHLESMVVLRCFLLVL